MVAQSRRLGAVIHDDGETVRPGETNSDQILKIPIGFLTDPERELSTHLGTRKKGSNGTLKGVKDLMDCTLRFKNSMPNVHRPLL